MRGEGEENFCECVSCVPHLPRARGGVLPHLPPHDDASDREHNMRDQDRHVRREGLPEHRSNVVSASSPPVSREVFEEGDLSSLLKEGVCHRPHVFFGRRGATPRVLFARLSDLGSQSSCFLALVGVRDPSPPPPHIHTCTTPTPQYQSGISDLFVGSLQWTLIACLVLDPPP